MILSKKPDGFNQERLLVIPQVILDKVTIDPIIHSLYLTDIGYFPTAQYHYRQRLGGSAQAILIFCIHGEGVVEMNERRYKLSTNQFIVIPAHIPHTYQADLVNPWSIHWLHFNGDELPIYTELFDKEDAVFTLTPEMSRRIVGEFNALYQILTNGYSLDLLRQLSSSLRLLLTTLCLDEGQLYGQKQEHQNYVDLCIQEMKENLHQSLSLDYLATKTALSKNYLVHLFHKKTGYSPVDYFIHLKIQRACQYLDTTNYSIKEIGTLIGYEDPYYFSRIFKKIMNQSPKQYRALSKG